MQTPTKQVFFFAGEQSGDSLGADLITPLKHHFPHLSLVGVGGPLMRKAGLTPLLKLEAFQTMGFIKVIKRLPFFFRSFFYLKRYLLRHKPALIVLIDYPGFNLRLARSLKRAGLTTPIVQYVCPSVWAWGKKRIGLMEQYLDSLMTLLPFEPALFDAKKLNVTYVGHPLTHKNIISHKLRTYAETQTFNVALFPGSRVHEIKHNLPLMLTTLKKLKNDYPKLRTSLVVANSKVAPFIHEAIEKLDATMTLVPHSDMKALLPRIDLAIATSGTITLELALAGLPCLVVYYVSSLDLFLATKVFRINLDHYSLPNIIMNKTLYPELFGPNLTEKTLTAHIKNYLDSASLELTEQGCLELKNKLAVDEKNSAFTFLKERYSTVLY